MKQVSVIYARVSSWQQSKGNGLRRQIDICKQYAQDHDMPIVAIFCEVCGAAQGYEYPIRKQAEKVANLNDAVILCEEVDRWSRLGLEDLPPSNVIFIGVLYNEIRRQVVEVAGV